MNHTCWWNFLGLNPKRPYLSVEEEKDNFCLVFTYSIKRVCEIRKFHVAGGGNDSKEMYKIAWCTCKFVVLSIKTYYFFAILLPWPLSLVLLSSTLRDLHGHSTRNRDLPRIPNPKNERGKRTSYGRYISCWTTLPNFLRKPIPCKILR